MINQTLHNITQSGTTQEVLTQAYDVCLTDTQAYIGLGCLTLIAVVTLYMLISTLRGYLMKSCAGCKRLKKCEKELAGLVLKQKTCNANLSVLAKHVDTLLQQDK